MVMQLKRRLPVPVQASHGLVGASSSRPAIGEESADGNCLPCICIHTVADLARSLTTEAPTNRSVPVRSRRYSWAVMCSRQQLN